MVDQETLWRALASPHRRAILDALRNGPKTTGQLGKTLPGLTRFAVMQHLGVLEEIGLILVTRDGRQRFNFLNPVPIAEMVERWVEPYSAIAAKTALRLKRYAESHTEDKAMYESTFKVAKIELQTQIKASPEVVFAALTTQLNNWWPHRLHVDGVISYDPRLGGLMTESWEGGGAVYGEVVYFDSNRKHVLASTGFMGAMSARNEESVEACDEGCLYRKSLTLWGEISDEMIESFRQGSSAIAEKALKQYCEEEVRYVSGH